MEEVLGIRWESPPTVEIYTNLETDSTITAARPSPAWEKHQREHPGAWNGPLFRLIEVDQQSLKLAEDRYSNYVEVCSVGESSQDVFVAVTGLVLVESGFVIGLRSTSVTESGTWEFAPAGSLQQVPIVEQMRLEVTEELGLAESMFHVLDPIGMFVDYEKHIADLILPVSVTVGVDTILDRFVPGEYVQIEVISPSVLEKRMDRKNSSSRLTKFIVDMIVKNSF